MLYLRGRDSNSHSLAATLLIESPDENRTERMEYLEAVIALVRQSLRPVNPFAYWLNELSFYECVGHPKVSVPEFILDDYPRVKE